MNKRTHKSKPAPKTSPAMDSRSPVIAHKTLSSVGVKTDRRKKIVR